MKPGSTTKTICLFFIFFVLVNLFNPTQVNASGEKYLIVHLDGVSSIDFYQQWDAGNLPNLQQAFANGAKVRYGLTLYPGATEIIYPRLKQGEDTSTNPIVGWGYIQHDTGEVVRDLSVAATLMSKLPRINRSQMLLSFPPLDRLVGLSLLNVPELLNHYDVMEFFWFNTDTTGHMLGDKAQLESLYRFDRFVGYLLKKNPLEDVNVILYTDHGMCMGEVELVYCNQIIEDVVGSDAVFYSYPNLYLVDPGEKDYYARELAAVPQIDFTFVRHDEHTVRGYHGEGWIEFVRQNDKFAYRHSGIDALRYHELEYRGEFLTKEEWLSLTKQSFYPAAPPNIFPYMTNLNTGHVVTALNCPRLPYYFHTSKGNHSGFTHRDLLVPILFRGPKLDDIEVGEEMWLYELYTGYVPDIDFLSKPQREYHTIQVRSGFSQDEPIRLTTELSPSYRLRLGVETNSEGTETDGWLEYDVYRSYLARLWLGPAIVDGELAFQTRLELKLGRLGLSYQHRSNRTNELRYTWQLTDDWEIEYSSRKTLGLKVRF